MKIYGVNTKADGSYRQWDRVEYVSTETYGSKVFWIVREGSEERKINVRTFTGFMGKDAYYMGGPSTASEILTDIAIRAPGMFTTLDSYFRKTGFNYLEGGLVRGTNQTAKGLRGWDAKILEVLDDRWRVLDLTINEERQLKTSTFSGTVTVGGVEIHFINGVSAASPSASPEDAADTDAEEVEFYGVADQVYEGFYPFSIPRKYTGFIDSAWYLSGAPSADYASILNALSQAGLRGGRYNRLLKSFRMAGGDLTLLTATSPATIPSSSPSPAAPPSSSPAAPATIPSWGPQDAKPNTAINGNDLLELSALASGARNSSYPLRELANGINPLVLRARVISYDPPIVEDGADRVLDLSSYTGNFGPRWYLYGLPSTKNKVLASILPGQVYDGYFCSGPSYYLINTEGGITVADGWPYVEIRKKEGTYRGFKSGSQPFIDVEHSYGYCVTTHGHSFYYKGSLHPSDKEIAEIIDLFKHATPSMRRGLEVLYSGDRVLGYCPELIDTRLLYISSGRIHTLVSNFPLSEFTGIIGSDYYLEGRPCDVEDLKDFPELSAEISRNIEREYLSGNIHTPFGDFYVEDWYISDGRYRNDDNDLAFPLYDFSPVAGTERYYFSSPSLNGGGDGVYDKSTGLWSVGDTSFKLREFVGTINRIPNPLNFKPSAIYKKEDVSIYRPINVDVGKPSYTGVELTPELNLMETNALSPTFTGISMEGVLFLNGKKVEGDQALANIRGIVKDFPEVLKALPESAVAESLSEYDQIRNLLQYGAPTTEIHKNVRNFLIPGVSVYSNNDLLGVIHTADAGYANGKAYIGIDTDSGPKFLDLSKVTRLISPKHVSVYDQYYIGVETSPLLYLTEISPDSLFTQVQAAGSRTRMTLVTKALHLDTQDDSRHFSGAITFDIEGIPTIRESLLNNKARVTSLDPAAQGLLPDYRGLDFRSWIRFLDGISGDISKSTNSNKLLLPNVPTHDTFLHRHLNTKRLFSSFKKREVLKLIGRTKFKQDLEFGIIISVPPSDREKIEAYGAECLVVFEGLHNIDHMMHHFGIKFEHTYKVFTDRNYGEYLMSFAELDVFLSRICYGVKDEEGEPIDDTGVSRLSRFLTKLHQYEQTHGEHPGGPIHMPAPAREFDLQAFVRRFPQEFSGPLRTLKNSKTPRPRIKTPYGNIRVEGNSGKMDVSLLQSSAEILGYLSSFAEGKEFLKKNPLDRISNKLSFEDTQKLLTLLKAE